MAPLPPENTERYTVFYTTGGNQHTTQVRTDSMSPSTFGTFFGAIMDALDPNLFATVIDVVTFAASGSTINNPVTSGIEGATFGTGSPTILEEPNYVDFVGRSTGGRRVRMTVFGISDLGGNFRVSAGEFGSVDTVVALLNAEPAAGFAIDGIKAIWKSYANTGLNSYWQRKQR